MFLQILLVVLCCRVMSQQDLSECPELAPENKIVKSNSDTVYVKAVFQNAINTSFVERECQCGSVIVTKNVSDVKRVTSILNMDKGLDSFEHCINPHYKKTCDFVSLKHQNRGLGRVYSFRCNDHELSNIKCVLKPYKARGPSETSLLFGAFIEHLNITSFVHKDDIEILEHGCMKDKSRTMEGRNGEHVKLFGALLLIGVIVMLSLCCFCTT